MFQGPLTHVVRRGGVFHANGRCMSCEFVVYAGFAWDPHHREACFCKSIKYNSHVYFQAFLDLSQEDCSCFRDSFWGFPWKILGRSSRMTKCYASKHFRHRKWQTCPGPSVDTALPSSPPFVWGPFVQRHRSSLSGSSDGRSRKGFRTKSEQH